MKVQIEYDWNDDDEDCRRYDWYGVDENGQAVTLATAALSGRSARDEIIRRARRQWGDSVELVGLPME